MKGGYSFRRFNCKRELIPGCWPSYRESMSVDIEFSSRNKKLFGNGGSNDRSYSREM